MTGSQAEARIVDALAMETGHKARRPGDSRDEMCDRPSLNSGPQGSVKGDSHRGNWTTPGPAKYSPDESQIPGRARAGPA